MKLKRLIEQLSISVSQKKSIQQTIQAAYRQFLQNNSLNPRYGQKLMIADIARVLSGIPHDTEGERLEKHDDPHICVVEAGTGTGKTVAYLLSAIPIAQALNKKLVISTATVALQEQIIQKDLPEVKQKTDLSFSYTLAKGRGRYLCLSKLDRLLADMEGYEILSESLYEDEVRDNADNNIENNNEDSVHIYNSMVDALSAGKWDGDKDNWPKEIDQQDWFPLTSNHRECTGRRCSNVSACSFFNARESLTNFDCIVANHDLVLADLALGGGAILPEPKDTIYIFDEGHHLPEKALGHFSYHTRISSTSKWLDQNHKVLSSMLGDISGAGQTDYYAEQLPALLLSTKQNLDQLYPYCEKKFDELVDHDQKSQVNRYRFEQGIVDDGMLELAENLSSQFKQLTSLIGKIITEIQSCLEDGYSQIPRVDLETWLSVMGQWQARSEANQQLWYSYTSAACADGVQKSVPLARWITLVDMSGNIDFEVCSSPILAANTLEHQLWSECYGAVVTSATLTALGSFNRFMMRSGVSTDQHFQVMPSAFDFSQATLVVPDYAIEANQSTRHTENFIENFDQLVNKKQGTLILFSSRKQMLDVYYGLSRTWQSMILLQGEQSKQAIINEHKKIIDEGNGSIIFGLASFAEGVDLPGDYCCHVVIAKLPFSVPDDPIEAALSEWVADRGGNPFMEIAVPDASIRLVQACGRLLRKETDEGKITIMDKRLITKRYGKALLNALPAYRTEI